ncbi:fimbria/pilus periplasmic chaperone [Aquitalea sp.]|uniref:fimbrial biogenesis chaperone n=1 Tax=Aquitalea sp. TaxID=1872623 RepID=UPI0025865115|nr:fimbria/pilus periplasmic chaperone [Aquitalea sp.]
MLTQQTHAAIVMKGTRIIFQSNEQETSIEINNKGTVPSLVQTWIDRGNIEKSPTNIQVPFVLSPPIFRIDGNKRQILRIIYTGEKLPDDRESIFWLNILEIPPKNNENNTLQFTYRSRIKLFFRPESLPAAANDGIKNLGWSLLHENNKYFLDVKNTSPFFVSLINIKIENKILSTEAKPSMVAPFTNEKFELEEKNITVPLRIEYKAVNDFGGITTKNIEINEVRKIP